MPGWLGALYDHAFLRMSRTSFLLSHLHVRTVYNATYLSLFVNDDFRMVIETFVF